jgi:hypothetical protein
MKQRATSKKKKFPIRTEKPTDVLGREWLSRRRCLFELKGFNHILKI